MLMELSDLFGPLFNVLHLKDLIKKIDIRYSEITNLITQSICRK